MYVCVCSDARTLTLQPVLVVHVPTLSLSFGWMLALRPFQRIRSPFVGDMPIHTYIHTYIQADKIRAEFEMYRHVKEPAIAAALVKRTEQRIAAVDHPDPYICTRPPCVPPPWYACVYVCLSPTLASISCYGNQCTDNRSHFFVFVALVIVIVADINTHTLSVQCPRLREVPNTRVLLRCSPR